MPDYAQTLVPKLQTTTKRLLPRHLYQSLKALPHVDACNNEPQIIQQVIAKNDYPQATAEKVIHNKLNELFIPAKEEDTIEINFFVQFYNVSIAAMRL